MIMKSQNLYKATSKQISIVYVRACVCVKNNESKRIKTADKEFGFDGFYGTSTHKSQYSAETALPLNVLTYA